MGKKNKVTLKNIKSAIGSRTNDTSTITIGEGDSKIDVIVQHYLSLDDRRDFVNGITDMVFVNDENGEDMYCAYLKKFSCAFHIITFFTNIELPADVEAIWNLIDTTNIVEQIAANIPEHYFGEVLAEVDEMIEFKKNKLEKTNKFDDLLTGVIRLIKAINEKLEGSDGKAILEYLEENIPELKGELTKVIQETAAEKAVG